MPASPSLLIVPARFKTGKLYTQIATTSAGVVLASSGDFNVTRGTTATRFNSAGLIESVASGVPRLDYYTSGGTAGCPALLVEPSAQNSALQSENFTTTWSATSLNITSGFTSPTNSNLGALIEASAAGGRLRQSVTLTSGATLDFSCFAKLGTLSSGVSLVFQDGTATNYTSGACQAFRLDTGQLASSGSTGAGFTVVRSGIENYGNGWYRCNLAVTMGYTPAAPHIMIRPTAALTSSIPVTVSGDTCYIFGAQLETGSVATSYIPTTTAPVTRNADVVTLSGAVSGCIGQTEGTIYAEFEYKTNTAERRLIALSDNTTTNRVFVWTLNNILYVQVQGTNVIVANPISAGYHKLAFAYQQSGVSGTLFASLDGGAVVSGTTSGTFPASLTAINVGKSEATATSSFFWNANIRAAALYTTRLTNAELAALTTL